MNNRCINHEYAINYMGESPGLDVVVYVGWLCRPAPPRPSQAPNPIVCIGM